MNEYYLSVWSTFLLLQVISQVELKGVKKITAVEDPPVANLSCYSCSTINDSNCRFNLSVNSGIETVVPSSNSPTGTSMTPLYSSTVKLCAPHENSCSVTRVDFIKAENPSNRNNWAIERSCSANCFERCVTLGEGEKTKLFMCNSCCKTHLCNVNNAAPDHFSALSLGSLIISPLLQRRHFH